MPPVIGYWKMRGLAQSIRLMLEYIGEPWEDKYYQEGSPPNCLKDSDWLPVKYTFGFDFPTLPYYIDGPVKVTHCNAILRHLARKHGMDGSTEEEKLQLDVVENQIRDLRRGFTDLIYNTYDTERETYLENVPAILKLFSDFLGDKTWLLGDKITYVDFLMYEILDVHLIVEVTILKDTKNLQDYHKRFQDLPRIKAYMASDRFIKAPISWPSAKFYSK